MARSRLPVSRGGPCELACELPGQAGPWLLALACLSRRRCLSENGNGDGDGGDDGDGDGDGDDNDGGEVMIRTSR